MNVITVTQLMVRRWWLLALFGLLGVGAAQYLDRRVPQRYQSTVSLQLNPAAKSTFLPYLPDSTANPFTNPVVSQAASYREVLRSHTFNSVVVQQLNLALAPEAIANAVNAQLVPNTNIFRLTVTWDNPTDTQQLAQKVAEIFITENLKAQQSDPDTQARLSEMESSAKAMQARVGPLEQQRQRLDDAVARGDLTRLSDLTDLDTRLTALQTGYANLLVEINRVRSSFDTAVILDDATPAQPADAISLPQALAFGLVGGLAVGVCLALLLEYLSDAVRAPRDVLMVAGALPLARVRRAKIGRLAGAKRGPLVMLHQARSPTAEAFRSLRANLQLAVPDGTLRSLVVSSAGPGDGKSFIASNLAITLAQSGKRVLLVDADLRRPRLETWFGVTNTRGLADLLMDGHPDALAALDEAVPSGVANLWLLPAGSVAPNPGELLNSPAMAELLERVTRTWNMVILDTAPADIVADTLLLAHEVDGCLLVARAGRTRRAGLAAALAALRDTRQLVFGVVLNDEPRRPSARFNHSDYAYTRREED